MGAFDDLIPANRQRNRFADLIPASSPASAGAFDDLIPDTPNSQAAPAAPEAQTAPTTPTRRALPAPTAAPARPVLPLELPADIPMSGRMPEPTPTVTGRTPTDIDPRVLQDLFDSGEDEPAVSPETMPMLLPEFLRDAAAAITDPVLAQLTRDTEMTERLPDEVIRQMRFGRRDLTQDELGGIIQALERGDFEDPAAVQFMLDQVLTDDGRQAVQDAILVNQFLQEQRQLAAGDNPFLPGGQSTQNFLTHMAKEAVLNIPDTSAPLPTGDVEAALQAGPRRRASDIAAGEQLRAMPISTIGGGITGAIMPFAAGVKLLRMARTHRGLAPVEDTTRGYIAEGAKVGGPMEFIRRPEGSEDMTLADEAVARGTQAGIGLVAGALIDFTVVRATDFISAFARRMSDKRYRGRLETEAKEKGFNDVDEYINSLVEFVDTPEGLVVRPREGVLNQFDAAAVPAADRASVPTIRHERGDPTIWHERGDPTIWDAPAPEARETIEAQMQAFNEGRKPGVLITDGESMPIDIPMDAQVARIPGRGQLIYRDQATLDAALEGRMGEALGLGIEEKPLTGDVITARDSEGRVVEDIVTDGRQEITDAAGELAGPGGRVEPRSAEAALTERDLTRRAEEYERLASGTEDPTIRQDLLRQAEQARAEAAGRKPKLSPRERARRARRVDEGQDDLITAIRKLGGIDTDIETDWAGRLSHLPREGFGLPGIERPGRGKTLDDLTEALHELGYLRDSRRDQHELHELLSRAETGEKVYSLNRRQDNIEADIQARMEDEQFRLQDEGRPRSTDRDWTYHEAGADPELSATDFVIDTETGTIVPARPITLDDLRVIREEELHAERFFELESGAEPRGTGEAGVPERLADTIQGRDRAQPEPGETGTLPGVEPRSDTRQTLADIGREVETRLRGTEDVPHDAGPGDLFSGRRRQTDIEDAPAPLPDRVEQPRGAEPGDTRVPVDQSVFDWLKIKAGNVFADYRALYRKHLDQFSSPEDVKTHVEFVLKDPDYAMPATKEDYTLLVRQSPEADRAVVVEFELRGGKYRVRSAYIFTEGQLDQKLGEAFRRWGGSPRVLARADQSSVSDSRRLPASRDAAQPEHSGRSIGNQVSQAKTNEYTIREAGRDVPYAERTAARPADAEVFMPHGRNRAEDAAALETLGRTVRHTETGSLPVGTRRVQDSADVAHVIAPIRRDAHETVFAVVTDDNGHILRVAKLYRGDQAQAAVNPSTVAGTITSTPGGTRAWLAHNHPAGNVRQSDADAQLTRHVADLLHGTGRRLEGSVVIGPGGRTHSYMGPDGAQSTQPTRAARRDSEIPVTERRLAGRDTQTPVTDAPSGREALQVHGRGREGVLLLDAESRPVGFLPMKASEMRELRTGRGGGSDKLTQAMDRTNADAFIVQTDSRAAAGNMNAFAQHHGKRLVDVIDNQGRSLADQGGVPSQSTFYANPFGEALAFGARAVQHNTGAAVAGGLAGAPVGGMVSEHEPGSPGWWADVVMGGVVGAGASIGMFRGLRAGKIVGPGSIAERGTLRTIEAVDRWLGRGPKQLEDLKRLQRNMRQLLDRETGEIGKFLLRNFTPAERALMADIIEGRGIVPDLNRIHQQAKILDDFLTTATRKMKELKMLPADVEEGGYLHRYYAKHLGLDKKFREAKGQSLSGSYTIARGTVDDFQRQYFSPGAERVLADYERISNELLQLERQASRRGPDMLERDTALRMEELQQQLRELRKQEFREYVGEETFIDANGRERSRMRSFFFAADEQARVPEGVFAHFDIPPAGDAQATARAARRRSPVADGVKDLSPTDRTWSLKSMGREGVKLRRDWTRAERDSWGEIRDAGYRFTRGMAEVSHDMSMAHLFDRVARNAEWASPEPRTTADGKDWVQVPKGKARAGANLERYGALGGMYVRPDVWRSIKRYGVTPRPLGVFGDFKVPFTGGTVDWNRVYMGALNRWKLYKTVYNPVTHLNNTYSNFEMLHAGGYNLTDLANGIREMARGERSRFWREARDAGLFETDFGSSILIHEGAPIRNLEDLADSMRRQTDIADGQFHAVDAMMRVKEWWINSRNAAAGAEGAAQTGAEIARAVGRPAMQGVRFLWKPVDVATRSAQRLYRWEDEIFKLGVFMNERQKGTPVNEAVRRGHELFFDYRDLPPGMQFVRDFPIGSPFISYTYKALPAMARNIARNPERVLALIMAYEAWNFSVMVNAGMDPDMYFEAVDAYQEILPPWNSGRSLWGASNFVLMPGADNLLAIGRAHALGNPFMAEAGDRALSLPHMANFWGSDILGSNPLHAIYDVVANEDWKGQRIYDPGAPDEEKTRIILGYLYQAWAPSNALVPGGYHQNRMLDGLANVAREDPDSVAAPIVDIANRTAEALGLQQFTGLNRIGDEIDFGNAALGSFGIKRRDVETARSVDFELQSIDREIREIERFLDNEGEKLAEGRISRERYDRSEARAMRDMEDLMARQDKLLRKEDVLRDQGLDR